MRTTHRPISPTSAERREHVPPQRAKGASRDAKSTTPGTAPLDGFVAAQQRVAMSDQGDCSRPVADARGSLSLAPPSFPVGASQAVFVDIQKSEATLTLDVRERQASVQARVEFEQPQDGCPVVDLVPDVAALRVDGRPAAPESYRSVDTPDGASQLRVLTQALPKGSHSLEMDYPLSDGVRFGEEEGDFSLKMAMRDLVPRRYLETYLPSNLLFDQFPLKLGLNLVNAGVEGKDYRLLTNATVTEEAPGRFTLDFPPHFNSCAPFLQVLTPAGTCLEEVYPGLEGPIPLKIYAKDPDLAAEGLALTKKVLQELEETYGPYPHPSFVAHVGRPDDPGVGGMEYAGATETRITALAHELTHSYFGRSALPGTGNAGWVDEAIASWRDEGYPRASDVTFDRGHPKLDGFSDYNRQTTRDAYSYGAEVMSELDFLLKDQGGLRPFLRDWVQTYRGETITTSTLFDFIEARAKIPLKDFVAQKIEGGVERTA